MRSEGPAYGTYVWPVRGPVILPFEPPDTPYGPGHRGIDIAAPIGSPVRAAGPGRVAFAGWVAGSLFVSIDHPDGVRTTYSWLSAVSVGAGDRVRAGQAIGATGSGHPGRVPPHLHFGARVGDVYVDPLLLLGEGSLVGLIHLAPLDESVLVTVSRIAVLDNRGPASRGPP
jgi:murein DD-endopeptidase MepM/ murein hydrolase activator NlpD